MKFMSAAHVCLDSYKIGHQGMLPEGITKGYSNFTPRSKNHFKTPRGYDVDSIVWCGLTAFMEELNVVWNETFFRRPKTELIAEIKTFYAPFCGPLGVNTVHFEELHDLGYLPISIKALPEGAKVPVGVPVLTITNTHYRFAWLPNFLETWLSTELWKAPTAATTANLYRKILADYAEMTGGSKEFTNWQIHDFSVRGCSGINDAAKIGYGHLLNSLGTDNLPAVKLINDVYGGSNTFVGASVPATEHFVMCAGGKETEVETYRKLINKFNSGLISIVSDTWDFWSVVHGPDSIAAQLKNDILNRVPDNLGMAKVVFRPDSGDPVKIICGYKVYDHSINSEPFHLLYDEGFEAIKVDGKYFEMEFYQNQDGFYDYCGQGKELSEAEVLGAVECLYQTFGGTTNEKGFRTLNQRVGLIYGDSITLEREVQILEGLKEKGFASDNIVFGVGSYTYQYVTRDTFGFVMKATYIEINGEGVEIFKDPVTDNGTKKSAKGLLRVDFENGKYVLYDKQTKEQETQGCLKEVFRDGNILVKETIDQIRARVGSIVG